MYMYVYTYHSLAASDHKSSSHSHIPLMGCAVI